jgi:hypothetical protein
VILLLSFLAPTPLLIQQASNKSVVVTSSVNNCGVKGYGIHDHDKECPNRPFPGRGPKD